MKHTSKAFKSVVYTLLGAIILFAAVRVVFAASKLDFTLHNKTGKVIHHMYCAGHDEDEWGDDILGKEVLNDGESTEITFSEGTEAPSYDLKLEFEDKSTGVWKKLDLSQITDITVSYKNGQPWANWENK